MKIIQVNEYVLQNVTSKSSEFDYQLSDLVWIILVVGGICFIPSCLILFRALWILRDRKQRTQLGDYIPLEKKYIREPWGRKTCWRIVITINVVSVVLTTLLTQSEFLFWQLCHDPGHTTQSRDDCVQRPLLSAFFACNAVCWFFLSSASSLQRRLGAFLSYSQQITMLVHATGYLLLVIPIYPRYLSRATLASVIFGIVLALLQFVALGFLFWRDEVDRFVNHRVNEFKLCKREGLVLAHEYHGRPAEPEVAPEAQGQIFQEPTTFPPNMDLSVPLIRASGQGEASTMGLHYSGFDIVEVLVDSWERYPFQLKGSDPKSMCSTPQQHVTAYALNVFLDPSCDSERKEWFTVKRLSDVQQFANSIKGLLWQIRLTERALPAGPSLAGCCKASRSEESVHVEDVQAWLQHLVDAIHKLQDMLLMWSNDPVLCIVEKPLSELSFKVAEFLRPTVFVDAPSTFGASGARLLSSPFQGLSSSNRVGLLKDVAFNAYFKEQKNELAGRSGLFCCDSSNRDAMVVVCCQNTPLCVDWNLDQEQHRLSIRQFTQHAQSCGPVEAAGVPCGWELVVVNWVPVKDLSWRDVLDSVQPIAELSDRRLLIFEAP